jgi:hypothetical protein
MRDVACHIQQIPEDLPVGNDIQDEVHDRTVALGKIGINKILMARCLGAVQEEKFLYAVEK